MQKNEHKKKLNNDDDSSMPKYPDKSHMKHLD